MTMDRWPQARERQQDQAPPPEFDSARPRWVRLTASGKALFSVGVVLLAGALLSAVLLATVAGRERTQRRLLLEQGADTEGVVIRVWRKRDDSRQPMVRYRFAAGARAYEREAKLSLRVWRGLGAGSLLPVRYLPENPALNCPRCCPPQPMPAAIPYLVAVGLATAGSLALFTIHRQRRLLEWGRPATGRVIAHEKSEHGKMARYEFGVLSGAIKKGKTGPEKQPAPIGSLLWVVYDPEEPTRNAPYPFSLVALAGPERPW